MRGVGLRDTAFLARATPIIAGTPPTITTTTLNSITQGSAFSQTLAATGDATITFSVTLGSLPTGLSLSSAGVLSGTPTGSGAYSFTVTATNGAGSDTQAYSGTVIVPAGAPSINDITVSEGTDLNGSFNCPTYSTGDLIVIFSTRRNTTSITFPIITAGPNGETVVNKDDSDQWTGSNYLNANVSYFIATAGRSAAPISWTGGLGGYFRRTVVFRVPAGTYDTSYPIVQYFGGLFSTSTSLASMTLNAETYHSNDNSLLFYCTASLNAFGTLPATLATPLVNAAAGTYTATVLATRDVDVLNYGDTLPATTFTTTASALFVGQYVINAINGSGPVNRGSSVTVTTSANNAVGTGTASITGFNTQLAQSDIIGYKVEIKLGTEPTVWTNLGNIPIASLPFALTGVTPAVLYNIRVTPYNAVGYGSMSSNGYFLIPTVPDTISVVTATPKSLWAKLSWTTPANNGNTVTYYKIQYKQTSSGTWLDHVENDLSPTSWDDPAAYIFGLANNVSYDFRVAGVSSHGQAAYSPVVSCTPSTSYNAPSATLTTVTPLRVWGMSIFNDSGISGVYNNVSNSAGIQRYKPGFFTSQLIGTGVSGGDTTYHECYMWILEFDTSCGSVTSGNVQAPTIKFGPGGGGDLTIEAWTSLTVSLPISQEDWATSTELQAAYNSAPAGEAASISAAGKAVDSVHQMTKPGGVFKFGAVSGGGARTYVVFTSNNHRTLTQYSATCQLDFFATQFKFTPS